MNRITVDGSEIACEYIVNDAATRSIVFIHGWMDSMTDSDRNAPALAAQFNVLRFDLPGHGRSQRIARYTFETYVEAALAVIARFDPPEPVLVGHSMGAMVAAELHLRAPGRWPAVILLDPPLRGSALVRAWLPFAMLGHATGVLPRLAGRLRRWDRLVSWWAATFDGIESEETHEARLTTIANLRSADRRAIAAGIVEIAANRMVLAEPPPDQPYFIVFGEGDPTIDRRKVARWFRPDRVIEVARTRHTPNRIAVAEVNGVIARLATAGADALPDVTGFAAGAQLVT